MNCCRGTPDSCGQAGRLREIKVVEERHYRLVPAKELKREAIRDYRDS